MPLDMVILGDGVPGRKPVIGAVPIVGQDHYWLMALANRHAATQVKRMHEYYNHQVVCYGGPEISELRSEIDRLSGDSELEPQNVRLLADIRSLCEVALDTGRCIEVYSD